MEENGLSLTREQINKKFGTTVEQLVFSLKKYQFQTEVCVMNSYFFVSDYAPTYEVETPDGISIEFKVGDSDNCYPINSSDGRKLLWNWMDEEKDFTYYLWQTFDTLGWLPEEQDYDKEPVKSYYQLGNWEQARYDVEPDANLVRCLHILAAMGYAQKYEIIPEQKSPWFSLRGYENGKIGLCVLDSSFTKNKVAVEKLKSVLVCPEEQISVQKYFLTDSYDHQYLSGEPGTLGGHKKLKIYGKLDCPSALKHIAKGQYTAHRVFFADEDTAIAAGYRPCGICMKSAYREWKKKQDAGKKVTKI